MAEKRKGLFYGGKFLQHELDKAILWLGGIKKYHRLVARLGALKCAAPNRTNSCPRSLCQALVNYVREPKSFFHSLTLRSSKTSHPNFLAVC